MKLPKPQRAVADLGKLLDYCLNPMHPRGRHKERQFASVLGISQKNVEVLRSALLKAALDDEALPARDDDYGLRYVIDF